MISSRRSSSPCVPAASRLPGRYSRPAANLEDRTPQGMDLLTLAIANAHYDMAVFLIERGADLNALDVGWSPLHQVVHMRTLDIGMWPYPEPTGNSTTPGCRQIAAGPGRGRRQPHD